MNLDLQSDGRPAASVSLDMVFALGLAGLKSTALRAAPGTNSRRSSSRFGAVGIGVFGGASPSSGSVALQQSGSGAISIDLSFGSGGNQRTS